MLTTLGHFWFRHRNALFPLLMLAMLWFAQPTFPGNDRHLDLLVDLLGFLISLSGQALRILTIGYDYIKRGGSKGKVYADRLVSGGIFAHSRNPLYLGNILIFIGLTLILNAWEGYLIGIPLVIFIYISIVAAEEEYLHAHFGSAYEDYSRQVPRWWPKWHGLSRTLQGMEFQWRRVLVKEYNTTFAWLSICVILLIWDDVAVLREQVGPDIWKFAYLLIPLTLAYLSILVLKKTHRL